MQGWKKRGRKIYDNDRGRGGGARGRRGGGGGGKIR